MDPLVTNALIAFLVGTGTKVIASFMDRRLFSDTASQVREDPRYVDALVRYLEQKEKREKQAAREMHMLEQDLMRELHTNEIQLRVKEIDTNWDSKNWFSSLSREETKRILLAGQEQYRLLMLVSPPDISRGCPESFIANLEKEIMNGLKGFLAKSFPVHHDSRPLEFYGNYFKRSIFDIEIKQLHSILSPIPTAILYSDVTDYEVYFNIGFWGIPNRPISLIPTEAWNWEEVKERLEEEGMPEAKSLRTVRQTIVIIHKLLAAFLSDLYYLSVDYNYRPQLFHLKEEFPQAWLTPYLDMLQSIQHHQKELWQNELRKMESWQSQREHGHKKSSIDHVTNDRSEIHDSHPAERSSERRVKKSLTADTFLATTIQRLEAMGYDCFKDVFYGTQSFEWVARKLGVDLFDYGDLPVAVRRIGKKAQKLFSGGWEAIFQFKRFTSLNAGAMEEYSENCLQYALTTRNSSKFTSSLICFPVALTHKADYTLVAAVQHKKPKQKLYGMAFPVILQLEPKTFYYFLERPFMNRAAWPMVKEMAETILDPESR